MNASSRPLLAAWEADVTERRKRPPRRVEVVKSSYQPSKADMKEEIDVSHLEGKTADDLARMLTAPVAMVAYATPAPEPVTGAVGTIRYNPLWDYWVRRLVLHHNS